MESSKDKSIIDNLKELSEIQTQLALISVVKFERNTKSLINHKMRQLEEYVNKQAKRYHQNSDKATNIRQEYKEQLDKIKAEYEERTNYLINSKCDFEEIEMKEITNSLVLKQKVKEVKNTKNEIDTMKMIKIVKKQLNVAIQKGDKQDIEKQMSELDYYVKQSKVIQYKEEIKEAKGNIKLARQYIKDTKKDIKECKIECCNNIEEADKEKEKSLIVIKKQNVFQKMIAVVYDRVNGGKKFTKTVVEPIKANIDYLKLEKIPNLKSELEDAILASLLDVELKKNTLVKNVRTTSAQAKDKVKQIWKAGINTSKEVINEGKRKKNEVIIKVTDILEKKVEKARSELDKSKRDGVQLR